MHDASDGGAGFSATPPARVRDMLREAAALIGRLDAEVLLAHHLGMERLEMLRHADRHVSQTGYALLVARRLRGEPVAYITGTREFWSLPLRVTPDTLIPRPDSETLIAEAVAELAGRPPATILDLGTGSGALLLAALSEWPDACGIGVDLSQAALAVARGNAGTLGLADRAAFRQGNWAEGLEGRFDLILSNPPYVPQDADLMAEVVNYEPHDALFAGDGLDAYRCIFPTLGRLLAPDGLAILEFGEGQAFAMRALSEEHDLTCRIADDLEGRPRAAVIRAKPLGKGAASG